MVVSAMGLVFHCASPVPARPSFAVGLDPVCSWLTWSSSMDNLERATNELRRACDWSRISTMSGQGIAESANRHNAQRASVAWS
ncbi:hypothetical protein CCZ28_08600 [Pseudomonas oryzihabitans]|uniref:Uncharacterized protein n=1 Tax=Pseudomonas oryzihabitans TaxID=47885 RepID=A0A4Y5W576_9PSED|nr:hypothetical protein CCZ28_08600 [Pseudomonas psychrotolerans]